MLEEEDFIIFIRKTRKIEGHSTQNRIESSENYCPPNPINMLMATSEKATTIEAYKYARMPRRDTRSRRLAINEKK